jgi:hypothetical protein
MAERIQVATNLNGPLRDVELMGEPYKAVSAVLVKAKVLSNNLGRTLLQAEDITPEWAETANGRPAVIDHPSSSANSPAVLNEMGVGMLFNVRAQDGALKADVYLNPKRADHVADLKVILGKLEKGEKVEVSTGFPVAVEEVAGVFNGQAYDRIIHPAGFDHLAVFAETIGACSVEDGCGLAQNEGACNCGTPEPPKVETVRAQPKWRQWVAAFASAIGFRQADNESDEDKRKLLHSALVERFGADDRYLWVDSVFSEDGVVVFEVESRNGEASGLFRTTFAIDDGGTVTLGEEPTEVRRVTTFEPVANAADPNPPTEETMNRSELIAALAKKGPLGTEALSKLSDVQLKALHNAGTDTPPEPQGDTAILRQSHKHREENEFLKARYERIMKSEEEERARLLDDLTYRRDLAWSDNELQGMDIVQLRKVHQTAFPNRNADYSGVGGPSVGNQGGDFSFVSSIMSGANGTSVLDRKEG